jgi:hypothetical protein
MITHYDKYGAQVITKGEGGKRAEEPHTSLCNAARPISHLIGQVLHLKNSHYQQIGYAVHIIDHPTN